MSYSKVVSELYSEAVKVVIELHSEVVKGVSELYSEMIKLVSEVVKVVSEFNWPESSGVGDFPCAKDVQLLQEWTVGSHSGYVNVTHSSVTYTVTVHWSVCMHPYLHPTYISNDRSVENIAKFHHHLKTPLQPCLSIIAPWRINQSDDNWICLLTLRSMNPLVLMHIWAWFLSNISYLIVIINK